MATTDMYVYKYDADKPYVSKKSLTVAGAGTSQSLFTVTGAIKCYLIGYCTTNLSATADNVSVGTAASTQALIANTAAQDIDAGELWIDATPAVTETAPTAYTLLVGDIILTKTANATAGVIDFYLFWKPISADGCVTPA